ncbi:MAG TPA: carboxypeptidase-like regulatory domain-containing protein, partial [Bacteroidia bacterium]|nr:carboxypeptidase-like regulatory domain-containing protein [Bacteroidia bacterium]
MFRRVFLLLFLSCLFAQVHAQTTTISGKVYNSNENEVMPFVSIIAVGTTQGCVTDIDGQYSFVITGHVDSIRATYVGYNPTTIKVKMGQTQVINIPLAQKSNELAVVNIVPGENPAI